MKYLLPLLILTLLFSCRKQEYKPYIGNYNCQITEHLDSTHNGFVWDSIYTENEVIIELDSKNMQFRDLPIPYKYIQDNGEYKNGHFLTGIYWGREIILKNDSLYFYHYEGTAAGFWSIRYAGKRI
ncbi:MAG: hypothetical protein GQ574_11290 [Crocinitomix sp.]|nr:hypothetical protein [Crocinitomix sp.]